MLTNTLVIIAAYIVGSLSSAVIVCKLAKLPDPRTHGSNNPGATNVLRLGGKLPAAMTLLGDMFKGLLPTLIATQLGFSPMVITLVAIAAFAGHLFPLFFQFRGGKGVATALGALLGTQPVIGLLALATWLAVCLLSRVSSIAALATFLLVPLYLYSQGQSILAAGFALIAAALFVTHRKNLQRIMAGTEPKVGPKST